VQKPTVATFTDEDCKINSWEIRGTESIVNSFRCYYDRKIVTSDLTKLTAEGNFSEYAGAINWYNGANSVATALSSLSTTMYGTRTNANSRYDWIGRQADAEILARYLLSISGFPFWFVELEVPFQKYSTLEITQVVEILHPDLPAHFGTASKADPAQYNGTPVDLTRGQYLKRAQRVRTQIESKAIDMSADGFPVLRLLVRVLDNYPKDPT
jgi:hypothetical protein